MLSEKQQEIIRKVLSPYKPEYIGVFGSFARQEQGPDSDLDLLVKFGSRLTLLDLVGLELDLSDQLGVKVDLVTDNALNPDIRKWVEKDLRKIA